MGKNKLHILQIYNFFLALPDTVYYFPYCLQETPQLQLPCGFGKDTSPATFGRFPALRAMASREFGEIEKGCTNQRNMTGTTKKGST